MTKPKGRQPYLRYQQSRRTMTKWIREQRSQLEACGYVVRRQRLLPPSAVKYLCDYYCIIL